jgi:hypothetical protein
MTSAGQFESGISMPQHSKVAARRRMRKKSHYTNAANVL